MPTIPMRPGRLRLALALAAVGAAGAALLTATPARADGYLSDAEFAYVHIWGPTAICPVINEYPTKAGVLGVMEGIHDDGFAYNDSVDIINEAVSTYCPGRWGLLVRIGDEARAEGRVSA